MREGKAREHRKKNRRANNERSGGGGGARDVEQTSRKSLSCFIKLFSLCVYTAAAPPCRRANRPRKKRRRQETKAREKVNEGRLKLDKGRANRSPAQPIAHLYSPSARLNQYKPGTYGTARYVSYCLASLRAARAPHAISITDLLLAAIASS